MKKILAMILCALMLMSCAVAETADAAWRVTIDEIVTTVEGEALALNPSLEVMIGRNPAGCWAQAAVKLDGENAAAVQLEYAGDVITGSADGADDVLVIDGAEMFLQQYELTGEEVRAAVDMVLMSMNGLSSLIGTMSNEALTAEMLSDSSARLSIELEDYFFSLRLTWEPIPAEKPFDLSQKNPARYTFREMFPGDGTDIPEALSASLMKLMEDESVQKYFGILSEIYAFSEQQM